MPDDRQGSEQPGGQEQCSGPPFPEPDRVRASFSTTEECEHGNADGELCRASRRVGERTFNGLSHLLGTLVDISRPTNAPTT